MSQALAETPGVAVEEVRIGAARIQSDEESAAGRALDALAKAGYKAHPEEAHMGN